MRILDASVEPNEEKNSLNAISLANKISNRDPTLDLPAMADQVKCGISIRGHDLY